MHLHLYTTSIPVMNTSKETRLTAIQMCKSQESAYPKDHQCRPHRKMINAMFNSRPWRGGFSYKISVRSLLWQSAESAKTEPK